MGIFDLFKNSSEQWFRKAQKISIGSRSAIVRATDYDIDRRREFYESNERERVIADIKKQEMKCLEKAIKIDPEYFPALFAIGEINFFDDKLDSAIHYFDRALLVSPNFANALFRKAQALVKKGNTLEALTFFDRTTEANPDDADAWMDKSYILRKQGKIKEADRCAEKAIIIDPSYSNRIRLSGGFRWPKIKC